MSPDLLASARRRRALLTALYAAEGAPIGYLWWAIPVKLRAAGVPVQDVAALAALLTLPWSVKFLWAPLVDVLRSRRFGLRPWIAGAQLAMGLTLLPLVGLDLVADFHSLTLFLLLHAVCAATQDVAIDALAVRRVPAAELGDASAWMQLGMLVGRGLFGGLALVAEAHVGSSAVVLALVGTLWATSGVVLFARDRGDPGGAGGVRERLGAFAARLASVLRRRATWLGLAFAALAGAGMEATGALASPLLVDRGLSPEQAGRFFALPAVLCMAAGLWIGGRLSDRLPRVRAAAGALVAMALGAALVAAATRAAPAAGHALLLSALGLAYVLFGVLTCASYALLMQLTDPRLGGTQFSAYMGAVNLCYVWSAWSAGQIAGRADYAVAIATLATASLSGLALLPAIGRFLAARAFPGSRGTGAASPPAGPGA